MNGYQFLYLQVTSHQLQLEKEARQREQQKALEERKKQDTREVIPGSSSRSTTVSVYQQTDVLTCLLSFEHLCSNSAAEHLAQKLSR